MSNHLCPGQKETIHLYLDGELNPAEREEFLAHLQTCQTCQALLAELQMVFAELDSLEEAAVPTEIVSQVMANLVGPTSPAALCPGREETIHLYLDGELNLAEREEFVAHLEQCRVCRSLRVELQTLFAKLDSLAEASPPPGIVSQVMANLPAPINSPRRAAIGWLVLIGQVGIGLALMLVAWPVVASALDNWPGPWLTISDMFALLTGWLMNLGVDLSYQLQNQWPPEFDFTALILQSVDLSQRLQSQWPPAVEFPSLDISPGIALAIVASLSLACLIGNSVLLRHNSDSLKNGET
jgi:anti-sigma factor RsiW